MGRKKAKAPPLYITRFVPGALGRDAFSFTITHHVTLQAPSFLVFSGMPDAPCYIAKVRGVRLVATYGAAIDVHDVRKIRCLSEALVAAADEGVDPSLQLEIEGVSEQGFSSLIEHIKSLNPELGEQYFNLEQDPTRSDVAIQVTDALISGIRIFQRTVPKHGAYRKLREEEVVDVDLSWFFGETKYTADPHQRYHMEQGDRLLVIYKVDRKQLERCTGVDLIYNFIDERRCVFVQYKCQGSGNGKYFPGRDKQISRQVERMVDIPGVNACPNFHMDRFEDVRLCRCSAFVKLCRRDIPLRQTIPVGVYFPVCIWAKIIEHLHGVTVDTRPHLSNESFDQLLRGGLLGSTPAQTHALQALLDPSGKNERLQLVFEERRR